jgi:hypothetical protein
MLEFELLVTVYVQLTFDWATLFWNLNFKLKKMLQLTFDWANLFKRLNFKLKPTL